MAANNYRFAENDSLLCYHGPMLYEAKCLRRRKSGDGKAQYFIHYKGWNSKWEEWVDDDRVLAVNSANLNKMASLKEIHSNSKKSGAKRSVTIVKEETVRNTTPPIKGKKRKHSEISTESVQTLNVPSPSEPKPKKRGRPPKLLNSSKIDSSETNDVSDVTDTIELAEITETSASIKVDEATETKQRTDILKETNVIEENEQTETKCETIESNSEDAIFIIPAPVVKLLPVIEVPPVLKRRLAYDYSMVTGHYKILKFPKKYTTEKLIRAFICHHTKSDEKIRQKVFGIGLTLMQYFNILIHPRLLYSNERSCGIRTKAKNRLVNRVYTKSVKDFSFKNLMYPKKMWHYVYGPTYLLRLFGTLPKLLSASIFNDTQLGYIAETFEYFLKFVADNFDKYFAEEEYEIIDGI